LKIAFIGTRGVPAKYGGFETCVEEVGWRLSQKGHKVVVYCRNSYYDEKLNNYKGMELIFLPNLRSKSLDTLSHTFLSMLHALLYNYDVYMVFNAANSPMLLIPRIFNKKVVINTDGLEWRRGKWGKFAKKYYLFSEWFSTKVAHRIIADSPGISKYYMDKYCAKSSVIAYGAEVAESRLPELIKPLGLTPNNYFLQITRFEPENNPLLTMQAYKQLKTQKKLVLVGGVPYRSKYYEKMKAEQTANIIMPGYIYDRDLLNELWCNCYAYIHGNEVGGTNPALLQAMAAGCYIIAINEIFNKDVLQDCGHYYNKSPESLAAQMRWALSNPATLMRYKKKAKERIKNFYSWDLVANQYEQLFLELLKKT